MTLIVYSKTRQKLYLGTFEGYIQVFDVIKKQFVAKIKCAKKRIIKRLELSPDEKYLMVIIDGDVERKSVYIFKPEGEKIKIYNLETLKCESVLPNIVADKRRIAKFVDNNRQIWVGDGSMGIIEIWERKEQYEWAQEYYKNNRSIRNLCGKICSWVYKMVKGASYDYYPVKVVPFIRGLKFNGAHFTNLHPKSTLTESDLNILDSYSAIVK